MPTLKTVVDGFVCQRDYDNATLGRLQFWTDRLGDKELADITPDDVDLALVQLAERGRLRAGRNVKTKRLGKPLAGATINRYVRQLGSVYKYARRLRLLPRAHVPPTRGVEMAREDPDHDRYFRPEEIDKLVKVARVVDTKWRRMEALITLAVHTGLRKGNLLGLKWRDIDLEARTATVRRTKNGEPIVSPLSQPVVALLKRLPNQKPDAYVFAGRTGRPYDIKRLWHKVCTEANVTGRPFHALRHSCGHALAQAGVTQGTIMRIMGHKSLSASSRYMHASTDDKRNVIDEVFG